MQKPTQEYAEQLLKILKEHYPNAKMILEWSNNFELLVAIILSAQCTDLMVNKVTAGIFPKYREKREDLESIYKKLAAVIPASEERTRPGSQNNQQKHHYPGLPEKEFIEIVNFAHVPIEELEQDIKSTGFYHNKAKNVQAAARTVLEKYLGILPKSISELTSIPGVGRKTANVFLGNAYHMYEGIAVDTHVKKQSLLLGLTKNTTPDKIEQDLMKLFDKKDWFTLTYLLIEHGRNMRRKKTDRIICNDKECILCNN